MKRITTKDVALKSGYSLSTVVKALGGYAKRYQIGEKTVREISAMAKEMGYQRNISASTMRKGVSPNIAVITRINSTRNQIISGILKVAGKNDFGVRIYDENALDAAFREICRNQIKKVISFSETLAVRKATASICRKNGYDLVFMYERGVDEYSAVNVDTYGAMKELVGMIVGMGHKRIAMVCAKHRDLFFLGDLHRGFDDALSEAGLTPDKSMIICREEREKAVNALLELPASKRPTAFCCVADPYGMLVERCVLKKGLRIPEDVSVTGFGKVGLEEYAFSPLTTIDNGFTEMGILACRLVLGEKTDSAPDEHGVYRISGKLIIRDSTGPAAAEK